MSFMCPACNGLFAVTAVCPHCSSPGIDRGRYNDYIGPYSPYRPIDEVGMTNGFLDVGSGMCIHVMACEACRNEFTYAIPGWG